LNKILG
jgi:vacuolar protein sorting-associated protein 13A/C